jgi:hypothetical protein
MRFVLFLNGAWHSESRELPAIMATVRAAIMRDWCCAVRIEKRPAGDPGTEF